MRSVLAVCLVAICGAAIMGAGPVFSPGKARPVAANASPRASVRLDPSDFRCILLGDSQTADPNPNRVRTQTHGWDAPVLAEQVCVGSQSTGYVVNNTAAGITGLTYQNIDMNQGWPNGGPNDFFALHGAHWGFMQDVNAPGSRIGRYRLRFGNPGAPWDQAWGVGAPMVARIAVRTSPDCIDSVETRAERGGVVSVSARGVHTLSKEWGVQIIEQRIPADISPSGDDIGVGVYLPTGNVEQPGQVLQILGVLLERVGPNGERLNGTLIGYQGRVGWSMRDHLDLISHASRAALVEMTDADHVMIMLGHNREPRGQDFIATDLGKLVDLWELAYMQMGRRRPTFVFVIPWAISGTSASDYMLAVESAMIQRAGMRRRDLVVNYLPLYDYLRPDVFDPARYRLDAANVHPDDIPTAVNLAEDLYEMLFEGRRE